MPMQPTYFINHGGGPCFFLEPGPFRDAWKELEAYLGAFADGLSSQPRAILIVSGHWEETRPTVNTAATPALLFDYSGFLAHTYRLTWPAPGDPHVAAQVRDLLNAAGFETGSDASRGWDHGVFVPLKLMFPRAEIPTVQLSLMRGLDPEAHLAMGRALRPLREQGVLIIGSGQSYHNMSGFMRDVAQNDADATAFDVWLRDAMTDPHARDDALIHWEQAPGARHA
jgi:aromatic ring-opening dioxygenase catalytic subunit (LigB family)